MYYSITAVNPLHRMTYDISVKKEHAMESIVLQLDDATLYFYRRVAEAAGLPLEAVLADALFKLAGELSLEALHHSCGGTDFLL